MGDCCDIVVGEGLEVCGVTGEEGFLRGGEIEDHESLVGAHEQVVVFAVVK